MLSTAGGYSKCPLLRLRYLKRALGRLGYGSGCFLEESSQGNSVSEQSIGVIGQYRLYQLRESRAPGYKHHTRVISRSGCGGHKTL